MSSGNRLTLVPAAVLGLTQLQVLVVRQDEDDVRPDVASVSLDAGLQALSGLELSVAERHRDEQEEEESARHDLQPHRVPKRSTDQLLPLRRLKLWNTQFVRIRRVNVQLVAF